MGEDLAAARVMGQAVGVEERRVEVGVGPVEPSRNSTGRVAAAVAERVKGRERQSG